MRVRDARTEPGKYATRWQFGELLDDHGVKVGVEMGVLLGEYSWGLLHSSKIETLYSVDKWSSKRKWWDDVHRRTAGYVLSEFGSRSQIIQGDSCEVAAQFADQSLDFVYIDGNHRYKGIKRDFRCWYPKVKVGGIVAGHDWVREEDEPAPWSKVRLLVSNDMRDQDVEINITQEPLASFWFIKLGDS